LQIDLDLEEYQVPAVIRKLLKKAKLYEMIQVDCSRKDKLTDHFSSEAFKREWFDQMKETARITFCLVNFEQKDYLFKLPIAEKIERVTFLKNVSAKFFREGHF